MPKPLPDRHGIEPENAEDRAVLARMSGRNGMSCRTEAGASTARTHENTVRELAEADAALARTIDAVS